MKRIALLIALSLGLGAFAALPADAQIDVTWRGEYYNNPVLGEPSVFTRTDADISFDWGTGSPAPEVNADEFSVRWGTDVTLSAGRYRFYVRADDNIAVTVDFANTPLIDTFGTGPVGELITRDIELEAGSHHIQVDYREVTGEAFVDVAFGHVDDLPPAFARPQPPSGSWIADYYNNLGLVGTPAFSERVSSPTNNWGSGSPNAAIQSDRWSARFTSSLVLSSGDYTFRVRADDGVRVYVDDVLVIDEWHIASGDEFVAIRNLSTGVHTIMVEYYENSGLASLSFDLSAAATPAPPTIGRVATVTAGRLNVRTQPSLEGDIITKINNGESYRVLSTNADNTWIQINVNGQIGWVSAPFVTIENRGNSDGLAVVEATPYTVNIRSGPGTQFRDLGNLPAGATAQVLGRNNNATWWKINYHDVVGWVSAEFARIEADTNISNLPVVG